MDKKKQNPKNEKNPSNTQSKVNTNKNSSKSSSVNKTSASQSTKTKPTASHGAKSTASHGAKSTASHGAKPTASHGAKPTASHGAKSTASHGGQRGQGGEAKRSEKKSKFSSGVNQISSSAFTAPILMLSVMLLLWGSEFYVKRAVNANENVFLSLCIVQIIAFFAPTLLYYQLKHRKLSTSLLVSPMRISHGVFIVFASILFFSGQILLKYFMFKYLGITTESTSTIQIGENVPAIQPILAFCVIPAVCEEFFFRGVILSEYRSHGLFKAVIISSVFFAFSHFSFSGFLVYLFAGFMLSFLTAVSRSVFPAMILHFVNNLLDLYAGEFFNELSWLDSNMYFFRFTLVLIFLISLWRVFSRMQHIYLQYSEKPPKEALGGVKPTAKGAFRSWTLLLPICAYLVITAITG